MSGAGDRPMFERLVHDLKGPLSPLQTAAYLLRRPDLPNERRMELAETVERQSRRMAGMIEELGDWVRAREERLLQRLRPIEVGMAIDLAVGAVPGCTMQPQVAAEVAEAQVQADDGRLVQALSALLAHAQMRDPEHARLQAWRDGERAVIEVCDAGPAVDHPAALLEAPLPEPFDLGLGLRLIVASAIARAHGGSLTASALAPGLAMRLELPLVD
jgi:K+-sensing histidine kinase KdpD